MGIRLSVPSRPFPTPNEALVAALPSDGGVFGIGDRDVPGTSPCNALPCGSRFRDTSGGVRAVDGAGVATLVTRDADAGGGCGLGWCGIVDAIEGGGAAVGAGRGHDADDALACNGTDEGGEAVGTG